MQYLLFFVTEELPKTYILLYILILWQILIKKYLIKIIFNKIHIQWETINQNNNHKESHFHNFKWMLHV
jgi:hypothetical protein